MTDADRDLLERAARASGVQGEWARWHQSYGDEWVEGINTGGRLLWNPLADDGDALRLAVACRLTVCTDGAETVSAYEAWRPESGAFVTQGLRECADKLAATRRAITRAAAAMGE